MIFRWPTALAAAGTIALAAGCGTTATTTAAPPSPPVPAVTVQPDPCVAAFDAWKPTGLTSNTALSKALSTVGADDTRIGADLSANTSTQADGMKLAGDLGTLYGATTTIQHNMPPSCIPNLNTDYGNALDAIQKMDIANTMLLGAIDKGNTTNADTDSVLVNSYLNQADNSMVAATNDVTAFTGG